MSGKMKVGEIQKTPQLPMPSPSFSFGADSLLNLSLEVDSLPVELQDKLRELQKVENILVECTNEVKSIEQDLKDFDLSLEKLAKKRDRVRGGVLKKREECLSTKEENLNNLVNAFVRVNDDFMLIQQHLTESRVRRDAFAQRLVRLQDILLKLTEEYLTGKKEFMLLAVGKQNADD